MIRLDHEPLVSIIIPVFNGAAFIGKTIESAQSQTYSKLEILVIDDGSTDESLFILMRYAAQDTRVRVIVQANGGVARARNRGIAEAHGEFIAPLDADDLWEPTKIERQVTELLRAGPETGFVYCWWLWIDEAGFVLDRSPRWSLQGKLFDRLLQINFTGNASVPLFRRLCLLEAGGYNSAMADSKSGGCEDWEIALRIADRYSVAVVPEPLVGYRRRPGSMSTACSTMWRSYQMLVRNIKDLRPDLDPVMLRRSKQQFHLYLAGLSFRCGEFLSAIRWGLGAGVQLPLRAATSIIRLILDRQDEKPGRQRMCPGTALDRNELPAEPLLPYDRIYQSMGSEWR